MKKPLRHLVDYLVLAGMASLSIILILVYSGSLGIQRLIVIALSLIYVVWGVLHHQREGSFHPKVALEYLTYALLGSVLVIGLL